MLFAIMVHGVSSNIERQVDGGGEEEPRTHQQVQGLVEGGGEKEPLHPRTHHRVQELERRASPWYRAAGSRSQSQAKKGKWSEQKYPDTAQAISVPSPRPS